MNESVSMVRAVKLINGEEFLATVEDVGDSIIVSDAIQVVPINTKGGVDILAWGRHLKDGQATISKDKVIYNEPTTEKILKGYNTAQETKNTIVEPDMSIIVP